TTFTHALEDRCARTTTMPSPGISANRCCQASSTAPASRGSCPSPPPTTSSPWRITSARSAPPRPCALASTCATTATTFSCWAPRGWASTSCSTTFSGTTASPWRRCGTGATSTTLTPPHKPIALALPMGMGRQLRTDMAHCVEDLLASIPAAFQSDEYQSRLQEMGEQYSQREQQAFQELGEKARAENIALIQTPNGYTLAPMRDD